MWQQFYRSINLAGKNFWRNLGLSVMTITILVMSLVSINLILLVNALTKTALDLVEERIDVSLLFKPQADEKIIAEIKSTLSKMPLVQTLTFFDRDQVLANFKLKHKDDKDILNALAELDANPFGASLLVRAMTSGDYEEILQVLDVSEYHQAIEKTTFDDHASIIKKISLITGRIQKIALVASLILLLVSFLIIFNTIRVGIYTHREEIGIMKLVGASNWFVRSPFFIEVIWHSLIAVAFSTILLYIALWFSQPYLSQLFGRADLSVISYFNQNWLLYFGGEFIAILLLNLGSAALAMRKFLKV